MKVHITVFCLLLLTTLANAQKQPTRNLNISTFKQIQTLKVGDKVPDILIPKIINGIDKSAKISDFKQQLLILDFWATTCPGCIEALPKMDELQTKFGDKIKILPVTYEAESRAATFWKKNRLTRELTLPSVVEDNILKKIFKHYLIPHEVWIYQGYVVAITDSEYVNEQNVQSILDGKRNDWPEKNDFPAIIDSHQPLFNTNSVLKNNMKKRYAALTGFIEGAKAVINGKSYDSVHHTRRNYIINRSILDAYTFTWNKVLPDMALPPEPNQILWEVKDPSKYTYNPKWNYRADFIRKHFICYESVRPDSGENETEQAKMIISDLDYLLGLKGRWEKRKMKALILIRTDSVDKLKSKSKEEFVSLDKPIKELRGRPIHLITWLMNQEFENPRVFDETGYKELVDMNLEITSWSNIESVRNAIKLYGLDLREEIRDLDMFVLTELSK